MMTERGITIASGILTASIGLIATAGAVGNHWIDQHELTVSLGEHHLYHGFKWWGLQASWNGADTQLFTGIGKEAHLLQIGVNDRGFCGNWKNQMTHNIDPLFGQHCE